MEYRDKYIHEYAYVYVNVNFPSWKLTWMNMQLISFEKEHPLPLKMAHWSRLLLS